MNASPDRLYELLPAVHRVRDAERGYPLRALLRVIGEQVDVIEENIARLYDNWFIETCDDWVVPYIADLIGYRPVHEGGGTADGSTPAGTPNRNRILIPRRDVAATLGARARKGTLALLELLARDAAGWPARAVEFHALLGWTQHLNHRRLNRGRTVDLREGDALDLIDGPFERLAHAADVRRVQARRSSGRYNIPTVGVFVWRLKPYSVTHAPAHGHEAEGQQCFTFSLLGNDAPLYTRPQPETEPTHIADETNLPTAIRRKALEERLSLRPFKTKVSAIYYGAGKSIAIYAPDWPVRGAPQPIPSERVIPADLSSWRYRAPAKHVMLDPVLGRIVFPAKGSPKKGVWVTYHYAFSADIGGGEYPRVLSEPMNFMLYRVTKEQPLPPGMFETINGALAKWRQDQQALGLEPAGPEEKEEWLKATANLHAAVIQIEDSSVYSEPMKIALNAGESLQLRAANRTRPVIQMLDYTRNQPDSFTISGKHASRFKLDGLMVTGRGLRVDGPDDEDPACPGGDLCDVIIRHSTLVPGWGLHPDCRPLAPNEPSLELANTSAKIVIEASILGSIYVTADETKADPVEISISDSIIDATSEERVAIGESASRPAFADLSITRSTVIGKIEVHSIMLGENSIFMSWVRVRRRQKGCMRFCYVTPGSRTPQRYHCQPDRVIAALDELEPSLALDEKEKARERESQRVRPRFTSLHYGTAAYCQLAPDCAEEIMRGADDESEMGVFHDLFNPQRAANLLARLEEYIPAGMEAGILFEN